MKTNELIRLLKLHDCYLVRHGANHDVWYSKKTGTVFLVGRHSGQEIKKGTVSAILKRAGIEL
jgi:predicted RNA binding protein YcfA (HicA-like mRNA interferase family)